MPFPQRHWANSGTRTQTFGQGLLQEGPASPTRSAPGEPPNGERAEGPPSTQTAWESRAPRTHSPTRSAGQGGGSAIPRGTKGSWSLALPPPSPLCGGGGRGWGGMGEPGPSGRVGARSSPKKNGVGPGPGHRTLPPIPGGMGPELHKGAGGRRDPAPEKRGAGPGGAESALESGRGRFRLRQR